MRTGDDICIKPRYPSGKSSETLSIAAPSLEVLFEIEDGPHRIPYVILRSALEAEINDLSKQVSVLLCNVAF